MMDYGVFISHGWHDRWIAGQMARLIAGVGATSFVDIFDVRLGDRIEEKVREGLEKSAELVVFLTPWSASRTWVWTEAASAWIMRKRVTAVLYGITLQDIDEHHGGAAWLATTNVSSINDFDIYLRELAARVAQSAASGE